MLNLPDRDFTGVAIANRNASGSGAAYLWPPRGDCASQIGTVGSASSGYTPPATDASSCATNGQLAQPRTDGYYNGITSINGVRNYYAAAGSWTSPDALGGAMPFAYAGDNAMEFSDPSGFYETSGGGGGYGVPGGAEPYPCAGDCGGVFGPYDANVNPIDWYCAGRACGGYGIAASGRDAGEFIRNLIMRMTYVDGVVWMHCDAAPGNTRAAFPFATLPPQPDSGGLSPIGLPPWGQPVIFNQSTHPGVYSHWGVQAKQPIGVSMHVTFYSITLKDLLKHLDLKRLTPTAICSGTYPLKR